MATVLRRFLNAVTPPVIAEAARRIRDGGSDSRRAVTSEGPTNGRSSAPVVEPHRAAIGGLWDEIGRLQFDFLLAQGLKPNHRFLDVGCGSFRGGVHFIRYLDEGRYYGIDASADILDAGREIELPRYGLSDKKIHVLCNDQFEFSLLGAEFDFAIAQSVFTHLPWNSILRCLVNIAKVLAPEGRLYATFFLDPDGTHRTSAISHTPGGITTYLDRDPYHYEFDVFIDLARRASLKVTFLGDWNHPRNQQMMVFGRL